MATRGLFGTLLRAVVTTSWLLTQTHSDALTFPPITAAAYPTLRSNINFPAWRAGVGTYTILITLWLWGVGISKRSIWGHRTVLAHISGTLIMGWLRMWTLILINRTILSQVWFTLITLITLINRVILSLVYDLWLLSHPWLPSHIYYFKSPIQINFLFLSRFTRSLSPPDPIPHGTSPHGSLFLSLSFFLSFFLSVCVCVSSAGGEDRKLRIWDLRKPDQALTVLGAHSHWVWTVKYNRFHDQLLLSAGSSSSVNLWSVVSVSSAPLGRDLSQTNPTYTTTWYKPA